MEIREGIFHIKCICCCLKYHFQQPKTPSTSTFRRGICTLSKFTACAQYVQRAYHGVRHSSKHRLFLKLKRGFEIQEIRSQRIGQE